MIPVRQISQTHVTAAVKLVALDQFIRMIKDIRFRDMGQDDAQSIVVA